MKDWRSAIKFRASVSVKDTDKGMKALLERIDTMRRGEVFVGITEESGVHLNSGTKTTQPTMTVLEIATIHEFGLGVPVRSFIREWQAGYEGVSRGILKDEWTKVLTGEQTTSQALTNAGKKFLLACRANFVSAGFTPLAPATIARKGFDKPLIETGQMYSSLTYRIKLGNESTKDQTYAIQYKD